MRRTAKTSLKSFRRDILSLRIRIAQWVEHTRGNNALVRADFGDGTRTLYKYLVTHRNKYRRHVGAHFLIALIEAGDDVFEGFSERHREHGWHFDLTEIESRALLKARDMTCAHSHVSNLKYTTNIFEQVTNAKQLVRMLGLGAVAGSAGILLGLSEILFFAKETTRDFLRNTLSLDWGLLESATGNTDEFVTIAKEITDGAVNRDGTLDATLVAERIETLIATMEASGDADKAARMMNADVTYVIGVLTGIAVLIVGRGLIQLVLEGLHGATSKIDALVSDMDAYANWKLGRSPHAASAWILSEDARDA